MQSPLGGPRGASWPHLEHSCLQFPRPFSEAVGERPGWAQVGKQSCGRERRMADVDSPPREVPRFLAAPPDLQMHISSRLPGFKASPGWRLLRASHLGPAPSRRKTTIDFLWAELWLSVFSRKASFWRGRGRGRVSGGFCDHIPTMTAPLDIQDPFPNYLSGQFVFADSCLCSFSPSL